MRPAFLAAILLSACAPAEGPAVVFPDDRLLVDLDATVARSAVGDTSEYYLATAGAAVGINLFVASVLADVSYVTTFPPQETDGVTTQWGPWTDDATATDGQLIVVTDPATGDQAWTVQGRAHGDTAWLDFVSGVIDAGATPDASKGLFTVDLAVATALDPTVDATGTFTVTYDLQPKWIVGDAAFEDFSQYGSDPVEAAYHYEQDPGGSGGWVDLVALADATGNGVPEQNILHTRWNDAHEGRSDAYVTGGDLGSLVYTATECWDSAAQVVFFENNAELTRGGDAAACAFADAEWNSSDGTAPQ